MNKKRYGDLVKNSKGGIVKHSKAVRNSISIQSLPNNFQGIRLFNAVTNHINKTLYQFFYHVNPMKELLGPVETYSKYEMTDNAIDMLEYSEEGDDYAMTRGSTVTQNFDNIDALNTAATIFSNFEHEFRGHGGRFNYKKKYKRTAIHGEDLYKVYEHKMIYDMQIHSPVFRFIDKNGLYYKHIMEKHNALKKY